MFGNYGDSTSSFAHDAIAADLIEKAADSGNEGAQEIAEQLNGSLAMAFGHRHRARKLRQAARKLSMNGHHEFAELAGLVAGDEETEALGEEAFVSGAIRGTHAGFGAAWSAPGSGSVLDSSLSTEERKYYRRKKAEESWSTAQAEKVMSQLMDRIYATAANYGLDDNFGGNYAEVREADGNDILKLGEVVDGFGGHMHHVFGDGIYDDVYGIFQVSQDTLKKRRSRLRERLAKLEAKLEDQEDAGKSGLGVRLLQKRIEILESRIERISSKIKDSGAGKKKARKAKRQARKEARAERSLVNSSTDKGEDDLPPINTDEPAEDGSADQLQKELDALEKESEDEWGAEIDVYGMTERRKARLVRRLARLEDRIESLQEKNPTGFRLKRIEWLQSRIDRLQEKVEEAPVAPSSPFPSSSSSSAPSGGGGYDAYTDDEYVDSYFGAGAHQAQIERSPFVAYFARKAESMGQSPEDGFGQEGDQGGFFSRLGNWFNTVLVEPIQGLFTPDKREVRGQRRQQRRAKAKAYLDKRRAALKRGRVARRATRKEEQVSSKWRDLRRAKSVRRSAAKAAWKEATPGVRTSRRSLALARRNVRKSVALARKNQAMPNPQDKRVQVGTEGWANYVMNPNTKHIKYVHPGTGSHSQKSKLKGKVITLKPGDKGYDDVIAKVDFTTQDVPATEGVAMLATDQKRYAA